MGRRTLLITYIATYLLAIGTIIRYLVRFSDHHFGSITVLVSSYLVLLFSGSFLFRRNRPLTYLYVFVQISIIYLLSFIAPEVDYWAMLFYPLVVQVMHRFPQRTGVLMVGLFTMIMSIFMLMGLDPEAGLPLMLIYGVTYFAFVAFIAIVREAEAARAESQKKQEELQNAHRQLQSYTAQAEELAVLQERNRLARNLHDSVTQSIYSLTLLAEAGQRMIESGDLQQAGEIQSRLGDIAQQALQEMRLLVYELRPQALNSEGLVGALERRLEAVERRAGIDARMIVDVTEIDLPEYLEEEFFHISMEALNNALKHAKASEIMICISSEERYLTLEITDNGGGFDPELAHVKGGIGLSSMQERVDNIGGKLSIRSGPGIGTTVRVVAPVIPSQGSVIDSNAVTDSQEVSS